MPDMEFSDISGDGKLRKSIIKKADDGAPMPQDGQYVQVHYTGKLENGKQFDSSVGRGVFEFRLGQRSVILGWDKGVATMKKGEKAVLICSPDYAYGETKRPRN